TQIKDFFGLQLQKVPGEFWPRIRALAAASPSWSLWATLLAAGTVAVILICRAISPRIPGAIVALLGATIAALLFKFPVETTGHRSHRADSYQHPLRRKISSRWNNPRINFAVYSAVRRTVGQLYPHGHTCGNSHGRFVQHGRVEGNPSVAQTDQDRHQRLAGHL